MSMTRFVRLRTMVTCSAIVGILTGCGAGFAPPAQPAALSAAQNVRIRDLGRTRARRDVRVAVLLRYNHAAELERYVDQIERTSRPRYLTHQAFLSRYAPTPQQEQHAMAVLRAAGFHITRRFSDRLMLGAVAPAATVERFFSTEIHDFQQARYGLGSANVRPLRIPATLSGSVSAVDANQLVLLRTALDTNDMTPLAAAKIEAVQNGSFTSGKLSPWTSCGSASAAISKTHPKDGTYDARTGSATTTGEVEGWSAICQSVTVPSDATLSAWLYQVTNEPNDKQAYQEIALASASDKPVVELERGNANHIGWVHKTWNLSKYAGKAETLFFGVYGSGRSKYYDTQYVDDVTLVGTKPTPTPIPGLGPQGGWGPSNVVNGLSFPAADGDSGQHQTIANVISAEVPALDIETYLNYYKIHFTGTVTNEAVDGGTCAASEPSGSVCATPEAQLDLETMIGLAPAANIIVYAVPEMINEYIEDAYNQALSDGKASVVNSSFGECETIDPSFETISDNIAMGAAAQGMTFSAAAGDSGRDCWNPFGGGSSGSSPTGDYQQGVASPASGPHFVAVGGTQSGSIAHPGAPNTGSIANPRVWSDTVGAGGSGVSTVWTPPPYQVGLTGASPSGRSVPDIVLPAADDDIFYEGQWFDVWGTSWASPTNVAMQAEINQVCKAPQWGINELYNAFAKTGYKYDFIDVTEGRNTWYGNGDNPAGIRGNAATTGFDNVSGIGIPLGSQIAIDVCKTR